MRVYNSNNMPFTVDTYGHLYEAEYTEEELLHREKEQANRERGETSEETRDRSPRKSTSYLVVQMCEL